MVDHVNITDPNIHEPKGVATANEGEVYVADGLGSGAWAVLSSQYCNIYTVEADALSVGTIGTTAQTLPFANDGPERTAVADSANNRITLTTGGIYWVSFSCSFSTAAAGDAGLYEFKVLDDGAATTLAVAKQMSGTSDSGSCSVAGFVTVAAGSQLTVSIESDEAGNSDDINIYNSHLSVFLVEEV